MSEVVIGTGESGFDDWITHIFDHEDGDWHWDVDAPCWNEEANPKRALEFLDQLFRAPEVLLGRFSPAQIGAGINFLANPSCSSYGFVFLEHSLPIEDRTRCLTNIATIYRIVFAEICIRKTHHGRSSDHPESTAADHICYMFWDVFPMYGRTRNDLTRDDADVRGNWDDHCKIEAACIDSMERTLATDHIACQEGALHGLGHWQMYYPERVAPIVDSFLRRCGERHELIGYARDARNGNVL